MCHQWLQTMLLAGVFFLSDEWRSHQELVQSWGGLVAVEELKNPQLAAVLCEVTYRRSKYIGISATAGACKRRRREYGDSSCPSKSWKKNNKFLKYKLAWRKSNAKMWLNCNNISYLILKILKLFCDASK